MAVDGVKFLVQLRKLAIRTIKTSIRSVRNHPFLVGFLLFVIFLYRSSPFLFSLLVSASPVLVCTAVLLGTLLSFGNPQIPEIDENDEKIACEISSLKTSAVPNSATVFQKETDKGVDDSAFVSRFEGSHLTSQNSQEILFVQEPAEEASSECKSREFEFTTENDHFEPVRVEARVYEEHEKGFENDGSKEGSDDNHAESSYVPWTRVNGDHGDDDEEDGDDDDDDDSGSDGAESSSPDPSMTDIIPLLDELHPLIECESLIPDNPDLHRNGSLSSHVSSINSDEETDQKDSEVDNDDEEEKQGDKEEEDAKVAITWTADDQKNLMDLGTSELERNQRLESLIARRRSRRNMRMMTEKNLIDLDDFDVTFQVAPISITRQNPFDFPNDTYDNNMDLPPIPGSAPSRMVQRRNPFDIPYDSGEEKPDLTGDSFQQEFMPPHQKEPVFRRHESFHIGSSFFEFTRQEPRDSNRASRFKPYFIPERLASEGGSSFSSFRRQSSEISESSSSFHRQTSGISEVSSFHRQSSDASDSKTSSAAETEPVSAEVGPEEIKAGDHDSIEEKTPDPEIDHASQHVEHGSQSSENLDDQIEKRDFDLQMPEIRLGTDFNELDQGNIAEINLGSNGNDHDLDSWVSEARDLAASSGIIEGDLADDKHYSSSSSSISSEGHRDVKEADDGLVKEEEVGENVEAQTRNLFMESDFHNHPSMHSHSAERNPLETIEEEHIMSPSSSLVSEERAVTDSLKLDEDLMSTHHLRPDDVNSEFPTEQASDSSFSGAEESHPKDPVYDLSPQASKISLSTFPEDLLQETDGLLHKNNGDADTTVDQEGPILSAIEERRDDGKPEHSSNAQGDLLFSADNELNEKPSLVNEDAVLVEETNFHHENLAEDSGYSKEQLISVAEEGKPFIDHSLTTPPPDGTEEAFVIPEKHEEVSSKSGLMHSKAFPEMNDSLSPHSQTVGSFSELDQEPVTDFIDFTDPIEGGGEFEVESSIVGDSPFTESFVPASDDIKEMNEALLSELDAVGDFHVTGIPLTQETLQKEDVEAEFNELKDVPTSNSKIQSLEPNDENAENFASDVFFKNESQLADQSGEVIMGEYQDSPMLENESIENVNQLNDEEAEQSVSDVSIINTLEPRGEPEFSQNDEKLLEGTEAGSSEGFESSLRTGEAVTDEPFAQTNEPVSSMEEEIDRSTVGAIEKINESLPAMEEEIERSPFEASPESDISENEARIEKDEHPAAETDAFAPWMEEKFERDANKGSSEFGDSMEEARIKKDEQPATEKTDSVILTDEQIDAPKDEAQSEQDYQPAKETTEFVSSVEEEIKRPATDALDKQPAVETKLSVVAMEEVVRSVIVDSSDFHMSNNGAPVEKDDQFAAETNVSEELTLARVSSGLELEHAEPQALQEGNLEVGRTQHYDMHPESISDIDESVGQVSSIADSNRREE